MKKQKIHIQGEQCVMTLTVKSPVTPEELLVIANGIKDMQTEVKSDQFADELCHAQAENHKS
jgi:hypothetical protein